ncbi:MAG: ABC transporter permease [Bryobacteraceae bacterium]
MRRCSAWTESKRCCGGRKMDWPDVRYAARMLRNSPVFAATVVVTIALAIGASTAIFSVASAVLLRPLPYKDPDRLVLTFGEFRKRSVTDWPFSNANFIDLRNGAKTMFEDFGAVFTSRSILRKEDGTPEQVGIATVTPNFFRLLGARIAFGRDFMEADAQPAQRQPTVAILSYDYWQRRYGGNPAILGHNTTNGAQIVGVLAPGLELFFPPSFVVERAPYIWTAGRLNYDSALRSNVRLRVIGRLKDGATLERAQAEAEAVAAEIRRNDGLHETAGFHIRVEPMQRYLVAEVRPVILSLMGAVIFLLLIACANVANLLLVRASLRERELAMRAALGASRWRLVRQVLAEALLLSGLGTLLGLGLASFGIRQLLVIAPANLPRLESIAIDPLVLGFTALAGLAAAAIFGMAPAWRAAQPNLMRFLSAAGRTPGLGGGRILRNSVVIAEVALSFVLLIGSGLMFRSFLALQRTDPGYDPRGVLTFLLLGGRGGDEPQRAASMRETQARLRTLPGVESVTASSPFPLAGAFYSIRWGTEEALADPTKFQAVEPQTVLPGYFETLRTPLIAGRTFTDADNALERNVVIVDQSLAAKAFPNQSAVGKRILIRIRTREPEWVEVIGVVAHQRTTSLAEAGREQIYFTDGFLGHGQAARWAIRAAGDPAKLAGPVRVEIARSDPHILIAEMQPMETLVERAQAKTRFSLLLIGVFAAVAALLAGVGLYGVLSTVVRQRTAEIGVRMALGATPASIFNLVVGYGLRLSAAGIAAGLLAAFGLTRLITSMLVGVRATDPVTFAAMAVFFFVIAAVASWLPARRAAGLDPRAALGTC